MIYGPVDRQRVSVLYLVLMCFRYRVITSEDEELLLDDDRSSGCHLVGCASAQVDTSANSKKHRMLSIVLKKAFFTRTISALQDSSL